MLKKYPLVVMTSLLAAPHAMAAVPGAGAEEQGQERPAAGVQLAQAYEFDVYIDQYGREIVVDPRTGRVVEIRAPYNAPPPPVEPRRDTRMRELGRRQYDFTDPRDVERFHRDREAAINGGYGNYEPPLAEPGFDDPYNSPDYGYEEVPPADDYGAYPETPREGPGIERAPLEPPAGGEGALASVPQADPSTGTGDGYQELRPDVGDGVEIKVPGVRGASEDVTNFQVLLDRAGASPGVIDGRTGDNVNKAISAYHEITGQRLRTYDKEWIEAELERTGGPAFTEYTITDEDAAGPFIASVPEDYSEKSQMERLSFTRVSEMLAERFHMDEKYLLSLNPEANFNRPGTIIKVVNPGEPKVFEVSRLVADKGRKQLRAYDERGRLVAAYPATIGSSGTPSPTGTHEVARIALNPEYTYDPRKNFKQGDNDKVLTIPPGPNGPVGSVWIALSKPTYGIHGTPDPEKIGKTYSNGCVRLTNWDAEELAKRVKPGVTVEFVE